MNEPELNPEKRIALFQRKEVRRTIHNNEWWFSVVDVVAALTDSVNPTDYLNKIRLRDPELAKGYGQFVHPLSIPTAGGLQKLNCANTEGLFRLIQSIPSPKAEPFKRWLAKVGYERIQEIEDPELATKRTRAICMLSAERLNEPPEPSPGLSAAMPWVTVGQNPRPEGAREALEQSKRLVLNSGCPLDEPFSRPFRAAGLLAFQSQGIALTRSALGCVLMAFQAILLPNLHATLLPLH